MMKIQKTKKLSLDRQTVRNLTPPSQKPAANGKPVLFTTWTTTIFSEVVSC